MLESDLVLRLPTSEELPDSDDTPVDNELQNTIPNILRSMLLMLWADRLDWFFGIDMGIYDRTGQLLRTAIVPDGFLSLGVKRHKRKGGRLSYVLAEEDAIAPIFVLEFVSRTPGGEYDTKLKSYAKLGVRYYVLYNPAHWKRDERDPFEVYRLENGKYVHQSGEPVWMPEIGLGIGRERGMMEGTEQEWLAWYTEAGQPYPLPEAATAALHQQVGRLQKRFEAERQRAEAEQQQLRNQIAVERQRAEAEQQQLQNQVAVERQRAEAEQQKAEEMRSQLEQERRAKEQLLASLQAQGIDLEQLDLKQLE